MLLSLLIACDTSNRASFYGGGEPHAEGVQATEDEYNPYGIGQTEDTGGTDTTDTTTHTTSADGPVLDGLVGEWVDSITLAIVFAYTDPQDDFVGGHVYWDLTGNSDLSGDYSVVATADYVEGSNAVAESGAGALVIEGADSSVGWTFGATPVDGAGNYGARVVVDIAAGE